MSKETLAMLASIFETLAVSATVVGALAGLSYVFTSRPLKRIAEAEAEAERREVLVLRERAAKAEKELFEVKENIRQRTLTTEQRAQLTTSLTNAKAKCRVILVAPDGDNEAQAFHQTLSFVLEKAGWLGSRLYRPLPDVPKGIRLIQYEGSEPKACILELVQALTDVLGEKPEVRMERPANPPDPDVPIDSIKMIVGRKN